MKRELTLEQDKWDFIERLAALNSKNVEEFIWECVAEFQNPDKEENKRQHEPDHGGFEEFWKSWPVGHKVGFGAAEKAWKKLNPNPFLQKTIKEAVERQKKCDAWLKDKGDFIPHASTWLNQKRWKDEIKMPTYFIAVTTTTQATKLTPEQEKQRWKIMQERAKEANAIVRGITKLP